MNKMKFHSVETEVCRVHVALDDHNSQEWAMLGAMFSRSNEGVLALTDRAEKEGAAGKFLERYYVGYGHNSIGDLVDVKVFIEGIPFYVAAMLEHHSQFRGQESSTRYIDFSKQAPAYTADKELYDKQIEFYLHATEQVSENINAASFPWSDDKAERAVHSRAIKARAFDITRSLLPLGATTNVAWFGNVRAIKGHLAWLMTDCGYSETIAPYAQQILNALRDIYPESIEDKPRANNPWPMGAEANFGFNGQLDFGSWRDLNRHRIGHQSLHLPDGNGAFNSWYSNMLTKHNINPFDRPTSQSIDSCYLGENVQVNYTCNFEQFVYVCKLRSKASVHPTLRNLILESYMSEDATFAIDLTPDPGTLGYFVQRGNDTITIKS